MKSSAIKIAGLAVLSAMILMLSAAAPLPEYPLLPTNLRVIVQDEEGNLEVGATVVIFDSEENYREEINPVAGPMETDKKGRVTFKKIPAVAYYIMAVKGDRKNDGGDVKTAQLEEGRMNSVNVVIR